VPSMYASRASAGGAPRPRATPGRRRCKARRVNVQALTFVFLVAPTRDRVYRADPLTFTARDLGALRATAAAACQEIDGVTCRWEMFLNSDALTTVREEILRDMQEGGTA
jgi:hypothetical protein